MFPLLPRDAILELDATETSALVEAKSTAMTLKQRLGDLIGFPRFRQRLLHGGNEMHDDDVLGAMNLQLVILNFWPAKSKDVENLIWACEENYPEDLEVLLQKPLDPNCPDRDGRAALHSAAFAGHGQCVSLLLEASADKDAWERGSGQTPLHIAALNGKVQVVQHLLKVGADKEKRSRDTGWTPLHFAAWNGHLEVVRVLLDFGAMKMVVTKDGATPLRLAHDNYWNDDIVDLLS